MSFPTDRPRRLRRTESIRRLVRETHLHVDDLVQPLFVVPGKNILSEIRSMPGQYHLSIDRTAEEAEQILSLGIPAIILFGIPESNDPQGSEAYAEDGIIQQAVYYRNKRR